MEMRRVLYLGWNVGNSLGLLPWVNKMLYLGVE
jgi:hypothetical protein